MEFNIDKPYAKIIDSYKEEDFFIKSSIVINCIPNISFVKNGGLRYIITGVKLIESDDEVNKEKISKLVNKCNKFIEDDIESSPKIEYEHGKLDTGTCKLFYVYKNLIQGLSGVGLRFNYFRGQSHDYPLLPGALRYKVDSDYINDFEYIYRKLASEFPDTIDYVPLNPISNIVEREPNLSVLQHYGLKTALLDITKNPYIAMLFMICDNKQKINEPTLYLFRINDRIDSKSTLFTEVKKSHINKRIDAQKGAFLNYEKMLDFNGKDKMPYVKIVLKFDIDEYNKIIEEGKINLHYINLETTELRNKAGQNDKEKYDDLRTLIMSPKIFIQDSFNGLNYELKLKLKEYSYTIEDMFPDFESRLRYVSNKYRDGNKKSIYDKNYRTFSNN